MGRRISVGTLLIAGDRGKADIPPQGRDFRFGPHLGHKVIAPRQCAPSIPNGQFATNTVAGLLSHHHQPRSAKLGL